MSNSTLTTDQFIVRGRILGDLRSGVCTVIFTKVDGTQRTMRCTLKQDLLPQKEAPKADTANAIADPNQPTATPAKKRTENNLSVWDLEKEAWRSFNITSLIEWKPES